MKKILNNGLTARYNVENMKPKLFSTELEKSIRPDLGENTLYVVLDWYKYGYSEHEIYKFNNVYLWTESEDPFMLIGFKSIDAFIKEFKLPKSLKNELEKL
jgi:hypothetical protein